MLHTVYVLPLLPRLIQFRLSCKGVGYNGTLGVTLGVQFHKRATEQAIIWRVYTHLYMPKPVRHKASPVGRLSHPNTAFKPEDSEVTSVLIRESAVID